MIAPSNTATTGAAMPSAGWMKGSLLLLGLLIGFYLAKCLVVMRFWFAVGLDPGNTPLALEQLSRSDLEEALAMYGPPYRWLYDFPFLPLALNLVVLGLAFIRLRLLPFFLLWLGVHLLETLAVLVTIVAAFWL